MPSRRPVKKVLAFVTQQGALLVFRHRDYPEAGLQVPAGTVREHETVRAAALREAVEETNLPNLRIARFLGRCRFDMAAYRNELQERYVYHLEPTAPAPAEWVWYERGEDGRTPPIAFCFFWMRLDDPALELAGGQGKWLWKLRGGRR